MGILLETRKRNEVGAPRCGECAHCKTIKEAKDIFGGDVGGIVYGRIPRSTPDDWVVCLAPVLKPACMAEQGIESRYVTRKTLMRDCKLYQPQSI
jgi:hypothetical protein